MESQRHQASIQWMNNINKQFKACWIIESTVTYRMGSLVVKRPSRNEGVPGSNPGPVILKYFNVKDNLRHANRRTVPKDK